MTFRWRLSIAIEGPMVSWTGGRIYADGRASGYGRMEGVRLRNAAGAQGQAAPVPQQ